MAQIVNNEVAAALENFSQSGDEGVLAKSASVVAGVFDSDHVFARLTEKASGIRKEAEQKLIRSFHRNSALLVQKTWVEKSDEALKDQVLFQLEGICSALEKENYAAVYEQFMLLLHDVVYLLFGPQSKKDDFAEYALRIDPFLRVFYLRFFVNFPRILF